MFAYILANLVSPKLLSKFSIKTGWSVALSIVILFSLPINFIDSNDENGQFYILVLIFLTSIGLGMCGNMFLNTVAAIFPGMFETAALAIGNIIA